MPVAKNDPEWSTTLDAEHPIKWEGAGGDEVWFLTRDEALKRLGRAYKDPAAALATGRVRTAFAWYTDMTVGCLVCGTYGERHDGSHVYADTTVVA